MKTNSKLVQQKLFDHIKNEFDALDYENAVTLSEKLRIQVNACKDRPNDSDYYAAEKMVEGGTFLISHSDVNEFIESLELNNSGKKYDDLKTWQLYIHLIASRIVDIIT